MDRFGGKRVLTTFLLLLFNCQPSYARDLSKTFVKAEIRTQLFKFEAKSEGAVTGSYDDVKGEGEVALLLSKFDTGIEARNEHMMTDLGIIHHPKAFLKFKIKEAKFSGVLTLNDVSKSISGDFNKEKQVFLFNLLLSDFKIPARSQLGLKVQNEVKVTVEVK